MAPGSVRGIALIDVLPALALTALVSAITLPMLGGSLERARAHQGARYVAMTIAQAQLEALRRGVAVALRIEPEEADVTLQLFADGNGNGVLRSDIAAGADVPLSPPDRLGSHFSGVALRINQRVRDPGGSSWIDPGEDPARIGTSGLVSCSPTGSLTSGTLYVASATGPQLAVRLTGGSGRVRVLHWEPSQSAWVP